MRNIIFVLLLTTLTAVSCQQEDTNDCEGYLTFSQVTVPATASAGTGIAFNTEVTGANLCYHFSRFIIDRITLNSYEVRAYGSVPCEKSICAQAIYTARPAGLIGDILPGTYTIRFYNGDALYSTATVVVN